jgi:ribosomal protein S6
MEQTFTLAGLATRNGVRTFRFANGKLNLRVNMLRHFKLEDIDMRELPKPMTKVQATAWVLQNIKGAKNAVIPTRAADKTAENGLLVEAKKKVAAVAKARATRAAKKEAALA